MDLVGRRAKAARKGKTYARYLATGATASRKDYGLRIGSHRCGVELHGYYLALACTQAVSAARNDSEWGLDADNTREQLGAAVLNSKGPGHC